MIDQGRHSIVPFYAQGSKKVYYYNFYYLQAVFFCCGLGVPALCEELNRTNHWQKNTPYSTEIFFILQKNMHRKCVFFKDLWQTKYYF